ncbi:MAG: zf-HC2 domain-containing protein [Clostridia bacterium]|nr:zf-HC2 domain-containing protein [Clostridia bacterium]
MNNHCEVIRDLLPLYADEVCSERSRELIEEHLRECPECSAMLEQLRTHEIEEGLREEKEQVIEHQAKNFRRRSATIGSVISGIFMIPVVVCLIVNLASGSPLGWFFIVLAALAVAASLIIVPLMMPQDKLFWTFCTFTMSLLLLLAVTCFYSRGSWFFLAASTVLFGLSVVFGPFVVRAKPVRELIGGFSRPLLVLAMDVILFANMMNMISLYSKSVFTTILILLGCAAGGWLLYSVIDEKKEKNNE